MFSELLDFINLHVAPWFWPSIALLFFSLSIAIYQEVSNNATAVHAKLTELYNALWNPLVDYSFKVPLIIKNTFYYPIAIDHRSFLLDYKRVYNTNGKAELILVKNKFPITPKANYQLLCLTTWLVTMYVLWATISITRQLYGSQQQDEFTRAIPFIIAIAVFMLDVWLVRSHAINFANRHWIKKVSVYLLMLVARLLVITCTASLAAFHILAHTFSNEIENAARISSYKATEKTAKYSELVTIRDQLVTAEYNSKGNQLCLNLLTKGRSKSETDVSFDAAEYNKILKLRLLPSEQNDPKTILRLEATTPPVTSIHCNVIVRSTEGQCVSGWADKINCPRFATYAKRGFEADAKVFGVAETLRRGWFEVEKSYPDLKKETGDQTLISRYIQLRKELFDDFDKSVRADFSIAIDVIQWKLPRYSLLGLFLLLTPVIILMVFEGWVLIAKTMWGESKSDSYLKNLDSDTAHTLNGNPASSLQSSHLLMSSDFHIQDHLGQIMLVLGSMIHPLLKSKIIAAVILPILAIAVSYIFISEFFTTFHNIFDAIMGFLDGTARSIFSEKAPILGK